MESEETAQSTNILLFGASRSGRADRANLRASQYTKRANRGEPVWVSRSGISIWASQSRGELVIGVRDFNGVMRAGGGRRRCRDDS